jgi:hypothetical protein
MNDQLIYEVFLKLSEQGVRDVSAEVDKLAKSFDDAFKKAGGVQKAVDESGKLVDVIESVNNAVQNQIKTDVQAQKVLEEKRKELAEVNKAIRTSAEVSEADAAKKLQLTGEIRELNGALSAAQKETSILNAAQNANINTYQGLVDANKALMVEMRNVPLDDTTGRLEKLQGQYKANNDRLKTFDATLGNHQRNVGGYREALEGALKQSGLFPPKLAAMTTGLTGVQGGFIKGTIAAIKFNIATGGILVAVGALAMGLKKVWDSFMALQPVMDFFERQGAKMAAVTAFMSDRIGAFLGFNERSNNSLRETIQIMGELTRQKQIQRDIEIAILPTQERLRREIDELRNAINDENLTTEERLALMDTAIQKNQQLGNMEVQMAQRRLEIARAEAAAAVNNADANRELALAEAAVERAMGDAASASRRLTAQRLGFVRQVQAAEDKAASDEVARLDQLEQARRDSFRTMQDDFADSGALDLDISDIEAQQKFLTDAFLAGERLRTQVQINELRNRGELVRAVELEQETAFNAFRASALATGLTDEAQIRAAFRQRELHFEQQKVNAETEMNRRGIDMRVQLFTNGFKAISTIGNAFFGNNKALAIATATVDAIGAAISAARSTPGGPIAKSLAAAAQLAQGFAQIRQMQSVKIGQAGTGSTISGAIPSAPTGNQPAPPAEIESFRAAVNLTNGSGAPTAPNIVINADRDGFTAYVNDGQTDITNRSLVLTNDI